MRIDSDTRERAMAAGTGPDKPGDSLPDRSLLNILRVSMTRSLVVPTDENGSVWGYSGHCPHYLSREADAEVLGGRLICTQIVPSVSGRDRDFLHGRATSNHPIGCAEAEVGHGDRRAVQ